MSTSKLVIVPLAHSLLKAPLLLGFAEGDEVRIAVVSQVGPTLAVVRLVNLLAQLTVVSSAVAEVQGPGELQGSLVRTIQPLQDLEQESSKSRTQL